MVNLRQITTKRLKFLPLIPTFFIYIYLISNFESYLSFPNALFFMILGNLLIIRSYQKIFPKISIGIYLSSTILLFAAINFARLSGESRKMYVLDPKTKGTIQPYIDSQKNYMTRVSISRFPRVFNEMKITSEADVFRPETIQMLKEIKNITVTISDSNFCLQYEKKMLDIDSRDSVYLLKLIEKRKNVTIRIPTIYRFEKKLMACKTKTTIYLFPADEIKS